jgi:hypothetical protein
MILTGENGRTGTKTSLGATVSTKNLTWSEIHNERQGYNRLNHGTVRDSSFLSSALRYPKEQVGSQVSPVCLSDNSTCRYR